MKLNLYPCCKKWLEYDSIYIISDPHFGDLDSFNLRLESGVMPDFINTIEDYNNYVIKQVNKACGKKSILICLGDIGDIEPVKKLKAGYKILIQGNHDKGKSNYQRGKYIQCDFNFTTHELEEKYIDNHLFDEVYDGKLQISKNIVLSHEPVNDKYCFNIHGHDHNCALLNVIGIENLLKNYKDLITAQLEIRRSQSNYNIKHKFNCCLEWLGYVPLNLNTIIKSCLLTDVQDMHREAIETATDNSINTGHIDMIKIGSIITKLAELWKKYPQLRFGQLLSNANIEEMLYYISDNDLIDTLYQFYDIIVDTK